MTNASGKRRTSLNAIGNVNSMTIATAIERGTARSIVYLNQNWKWSDWRNC